MYNIRLGEVTVVYAPLKLASQKVIVIFCISCKCSASVTPYNREHVSLNPERTGRSSRTLELNFSQKLLTNLNLMLKWEKVSARISSSASFRTLNLLRSHSDLLTGNLQRKFSTEIVVPT
jgi:hypothetical protein